MSFNKLNISPPQKYFPAQITQQIKFLASKDLAGTNITQWIKPFAPQSNYCSELHNHPTNQISRQQRSRRHKYYPMNQTFPPPKQILFRIDQCFRSQHLHPFELINLFAPLAQTSTCTQPPCPPSMFITQVHLLTPQLICHPASINLLAPQRVFHSSLSTIPPSSHIPYCTSQSPPAPP